MRRSAVLTLAVVVGLWAGWGMTQPLTAVPLEPFLGEPVQMSDVTPRAATLRVSTLIDLACVVVYGKDESFGLLALDQDMGGGAHREHFVALRGLEPATDYVYRLQGSAPDGTFYASETYRFRTPAADMDAGSVDLGVNVATLGRGARVVAVSSEFGESFRAENALDGDPATEWSSRGDGDAAYLSVELPERVRVTGFGLWTRTMGRSAEIRRFTVENEDGDVYGPFALPDATGVYRFPAAGEGRRFTVRVTESSGGNTGIVTLEIFTDGATE